VSKRHARLTVENDYVVVEDLESTNGTYVNGKAVTRANVADGDLLQFANALYRVGRAQRNMQESTISVGILPFAQTLLLFDRLINERSVIPHFQPIVTIDRLHTRGYELLARSALEGLSTPAMMFGAAARLGQQAALSELLREEGIKKVYTSKGPACEYFLNTHPCEVINDRLVESLTALRASFPDIPIVIEIHEAAVTAPVAIQCFRTVLRNLNMRLCYDDFGSGQGRLLELGEVPPDVLKFDMQLIRDIDQASATRQEMLATMVRLAIDLGTTPLAEGVETEAEHATCAQMGFQLAQGYLYGRPKPF
jgi:EAL domain-containing protein (putative c-di-GMP-specific phosphodiesterase class I)